MGLLDGLEKLVNEHGSAVILKERIELANDKYAALERKLAESEAKVSRLEKEKHSIERENSALKDQLSALERKAEQRQSDRLDAVREKALLALSSRRETVAAELAQVLGIGEPLATFHLEELEKISLVHGARFYTGRSTLWKIASNGRAYLATHGLLS